MKLSARPDKAANQTPSRTGRIPARSKSTVNLGELKNLSSVNSRDDANLAPSEVSKDQKRRTIARGMERCKSSAVLEEAKIENSLDEPRRLEASEIAEVEELQEETSIFHIELDGEEPRPSQESEICDANLEKHEISKCKAEADDELVDVSKSNSALDSEKETPEEQRAVEAAASASRARKKWVIAEKPSIATSNSSDNLLKDVVKHFKKLIKIGRKGRIASNIASVSSDSGGGGGDNEDRRRVLKLSSEHLKKPNNDCSVPDRIAGLKEVKIFPGQGN